jgi:hypothetical protein
MCIEEKKRRRGELREFIAALAADYYPFGALVA